eukprot:3996697-Pyramimonas_sp.AAC.1
MRAAPTAATRACCRGSNPAQPPDTRHTHTERSAVRARRHHVALPSAPIGQRSERAAATWRFHP